MAERRHTLLHSLLMILGIITGALLLLTAGCDATSFDLSPRRAAEEVSFRRSGIPASPEIPRLISNEFRARHTAPRRDTMKTMLPSPLEDLQAMAAHRVGEKAGDPPVVELEEDSVGNGGGLAQNSAPSTPPPYRIRTGDTLVISIPFEEGSKMRVPVRPDGRIGYLFNIEIMAAGLTYKELHARLEKELSKYYKTPRVAVVGESFAGNAVYVMGPVTKPGSHEIHNSTRLVDVLARAGVLSQRPQVFGNEETQEVVDLKGAYIARGNQILNVDFEALLLKGDMRQNIQLQPQDFIFIPSVDLTGGRQKVYICGAVGNPQVLRFTRRLSLVEAVTEAGGPVENKAVPSDCLVIRPGAKQPIRANYRDMVMGRGNDMALQNGDIIYMPERRLYYGSKVVTTVVNEILAPLQSVLDADTMAKRYYQRDFGPSGTYPVE